ncbi:hypothetical protein I312_103602 [Cryptococcus bacillisporus CA1280]|uniref:uncharacterized protein n=1 Tax=Cryptococcus bacillisporus CA1280 TaxID=1296109 RepID=UPI003369502B
MIFSFPRLFAFPPSSASRRTSDESVTACEILDHAQNRSSPTNSSSPGNINDEQTMSAPCISLHNFDERRDEIIEELMDASMNRMQSADIARQAVCSLCVLLTVTEVGPILARFA